MDILTTHYKRNPNEKVLSLYRGVSSGGGGVQVLVKKHPTEDRLQRIITPVETLVPGQGGLAAVIVLGGMETTLDEVEYILEARRQKKWEPRRNGSEIAEMCRVVAEKRNEALLHFKKNPSEVPARKKVGLFLPTGYRMVRTKEPGLRISVKV